MSVFKFFQARQIGDRAHRIVLQIAIEQFEIGLEILDLAAAKLDVVIAELIADGFLILARQIEHRRIEVDADHFALSAGDLRDDIAGFAAARSEIENGFACTNVARWIAAAVIFFDDLFGNDFEKRLVVAHRQAETSFDFRGSVAVTLQHGRFQACCAPIIAFSCDADDSILVHRNLPGSVATCPERKSSSMGSCNPRIDARARARVAG